MIAAACFHESSASRIPAAGLDPGLRRIDELLPLVLARYVQRESSPPLAAERFDREVSETEFVASSRTGHKVRPR